MKEFIEIDTIFSADKRNQSKTGLKLANSINIEDLIETGKTAEENNTIDQIKIGQLQADIMEKIRHGPLP